MSYDVIQKAVAGCYRDNNGKSGWLPVMLIKKLVLDRFGEDISEEDIDTGFKRMVNEGLLRVNVEISYLDIHDEHSSRSYDLDSSTDFTQYDGEIEDFIVIPWGEGGFYHCQKVYDHVKSIGLYDIEEVQSIAYTYYYTDEWEQRKKYLVKVGSKGDPGELSRQGVDHMLEAIYNAGLKEMGYIEEMSSFIIEGLPSCVETLDELCLLKCTCYEIEQLDNEYRG